MNEMENENKPKIRSWVGAGGSLMVSENIPGVTQKLSDKTAEFYGGVNFVCETISRSCAKEISKSMGWEFREDLTTEKVETVIRSFSDLAVSCQFTSLNDADCHHPDIDFSCMLCAPCNCPLLLG